mgnify:FL=1
MQLRRLIARWFRRRAKSLGERGEDAAARFLRRKGYRILGRRVAVARGDIDLVAVDGQTVVIVEVKTRSSDAAGGAAAAVDDAKQRQLRRLAQYYIHQHGLIDFPVRFDVVAITWPPGERRPQVDHYIGAF